MSGLSVLSGCIEEYDADIPSEDTNMLVVEGTIGANRQNTFILSHTQSVKSTEAPQMVMAARVSVCGSDGSEYRADGYAGEYTCWIGALDPDVEYYLHIEADGDVYESEPQKPLRTEEIADVCGVQNTPESNIDVLVTPEAPFSSDQANYYSWTCDETYVVHPDYQTTLFFDITVMKPIYKTNQFPLRGWIDETGRTIMIGASTGYEGQHIQRFKMYDIDRSDECIYYRYSGLIHQRAISKGEYEYELARRQAGSEMGGLFTPLPSSLPTNIHCLTSDKGVIGYVGCSLNTTEYRFFLNGGDFSLYRPPKEDTRLWYDNPDMELCYRLATKGLYLCVWDDQTMSGGKLRTAWAYEYQLDVRYKGAYIEEPDFWKD